MQHHNQKISIKCVKGLGDVDLESKVPTILPFVNRIIASEAIMTQSKMLRSRTKPRCSIDIILEVIQASLSATILVIVLN